MNELRSQSNADLLQVATSKNYGKSTRKAARAILEERGVKIDDATFSNPSAGNVPDSPADRRAERSNMWSRIIVAVIVAMIIGVIRVIMRS
jgi:hypothetical protein